MTLDEFFNIPKGMSMEEWEKELKRQKRQDRKKRKLSDQIQECEDALEVLEDEKGSDRWVKWNDRLTELQGKLGELT